MNHTHFSYEVALNLISNSIILVSMAKWYLH